MGGNPNPSATFFVTVRRNSVQAGFLKENLSGVISNDPLPNGAWVAAASISLASCSFRGNLITPIPSMYKPERGVDVKVSLRANFPLKSKAPLNALSRSP